MSVTPVRVFAPASVANFGVGFDCVGAALDGPGDVVTIRPSRRAGVTLDGVTGDRGRLPREPERNTATVAATVVLEAAMKAGRAGPRTGLALTLEKGLPLASGLGSSAASAAAGARAAALALGFSSRTALLRAVLIAENAADGSWHGDNAYAALLGGLLLVPSSDPRRPCAPIALPVPPRMRLVLVHPELELPTAASRLVLPRDVPLGVHTHQAAALAGLVCALHAGDVAAAGRWVVADRIVEPRRSTLVPGYDEVTEAMKKAGALGYALAGAGPSILGLAEEGDAPARIAKAAEKAWKAQGIAAEARVHTVDTQGARAV